MLSAEFKGTFQVDIVRQVKELSHHMTNTLGRQCDSNGRQSTRGVPDESKKEHIYLEQTKV